MELEWGDNIERNANVEEEAVEVVDGAENDSPATEEGLIVGRAEIDILRCGRQTTLLVKICQKKMKQTWQHGRLR